MKYIIKRKSSFNKGKYEINCDSKALCTGKVTPSKEYKERYNIKLSNAINKYIGEQSCVVEPDSTQTQSYLIYLKDDKTKEKNLVAQLNYRGDNNNNFLYMIIIGDKLYQVRSCDLKDRRLTIIDAIQSNNSSVIHSPSTLLQVTDSFVKSTKKYHVTINDKKWQYVYLALIILLDLHECQRNIS